MQGYRITFSKPGATAPYLTVWQKVNGLYGRDEIAPLGGNVEVLRGGFCGSGSLRLSAPPDMQIGDHVRVWLPGDPDDTPTYLGEVLDEPWEKGEGEVKLRSVAESVAKSKWAGNQENRFPFFILQVLNSAVLPPGIKPGDVADSLAILRANTPFELVGDSLNAAVPAIDGATWGVTAQGRVAVAAPVDTLTHRFTKGYSVLEPGTGQGYANCVRFSYARPDGAQAWFEGRIEPEVARRGEHWEVTNVPASVTEAYQDPVEGLDAVVAQGVEYRYEYGTAPNYRSIRETLSASVPAFDKNWDGSYRDYLPPDPSLSLGVDLPLYSVEESVHRIQVLRYVDDTRATFHVKGRKLPLQYAIEVKGGASDPNVPWTNISPSDVAADGTEFFTVNVGPSGGSVDVFLRYDPAEFKPGTTAFELGSEGHLNAPDGTTAPNTQAHAAVHLYLGLWSDPRKKVELQFLLPLYSTTPGLWESAEVQPKLKEVVYDVNVDVALPGAVILQGGSLVFVKGTPTSLSLVGGESSTSLTMQRIDEFGVSEWMTPASSQPMTVVRLFGNASTLGYIAIKAVRLTDLAGYAYGLLRYKVQPVRTWKGEYRTLRHVAAYGTASFQTPNGDAVLDVQRVTYDLTTETVSVECGTPLPREEEAIGTALSGVRREARSPSQSSGEGPVTTASLALPDYVSGGKTP